MMRDAGNEQDEEISDVSSSTLIAHTHFGVASSVRDRCWQSIAKADRAAAKKRSASGGPSRSWALTEKLNRRLEASTIESTAGYWDEEPSKESTKKKAKLINFDELGTRTQNLSLRRGTRYPRGRLVFPESQTQLVTLTLRQPAIV